MAHTDIPAVKDRWLTSDPLPADVVIAQLIDDAEDTILAAIPDLEERINDGRIPLPRMQKIVARMVIRHVQNPTGIRQTQETTGPFNRGVTYGGEEPGAIWLTKDEKRELLGQTSRSGAAFQIDTVPTHVGRRAYDAESA